MAGYNYQKGGYTTHNGWDTHTDDWIHENYSGNGHSDHVHHPVIVDAQGKERPISESYVTQTETVIERVQVPVVTEYKYISPTEVESFSNYRVENDRWRWPKSTPVVQDRPQKVDLHVQTTTPTEQTKFYREVNLPTRITFTAPPPTVPQKKPYGDIIDSREATRRYGNSKNSSARPYKREETYTGVIDSREAVKRYGGTYV